MFFMYITVCVSHHVYDLRHCSSSCILYIYSTAVASGGQAVAPLSMATPMIYITAVVIHHVRYVYYITVD